MGDSDEEKKRKKKKRKNDFDEGDLRLEYQRLKEVNEALTKKVEELQQTLEVCGIHQNDLLSEVVDLDLDEAPRTNTQINKAQDSHKKDPFEIKQQNKSQMPPAFIAHNINQKKMFADLTDLLKHKNFTFNIINQNVTKILCSTKNDYIKILFHLKDVKVSFYTYTPADLKPFSYVIKKLPYAYDDADVIKYINELKLNIKFKVT